MPGHAGKNWIAVIHLADDKGTYQGQQGMTWERTPHTSDMVRAMVSIDDL